MKPIGFRGDIGFRIFVEKRLPHQVRAGYAQCGLNRNQGIALTGGGCFPGPRKGRFKHTLLRRLEKVDSGEMDVPEILSLDAFQNHCKNGRFGGNVGNFFVFCEVGYTKRPHEIKCAKRFV